jgi:hypothetical protein
MNYILIHKGREGIVGVVLNEIRLPQFWDANAIVLAVDVKEFNGRLEIESIEQIRPTTREVIKKYEQRTADDRGKLPITTEA